MKTFNFEQPTEERFQEVMKLQEMLLHDQINLEEFNLRVPDDDLRNFRCFAEMKMRDETL